MKTDREKRLEAALRMVATHDPSDGQCDNGYSPEYVAREALADEGAGRGDKPMSEMTAHELDRALAQHDQRGEDDG